MVLVIDLSLTNLKARQGFYWMMVVQFFICIMAPVVLFQDSHIILGVVAVINLFVYAWSFLKFRSATGTPPNS